MGTPTSIGKLLYIAQIVIQEKKFF
uniref:Uncharacterized protein n=1 Tax=Anguilla anguilla TaxID=7936 RepID=A0A0E9R2N0_ANGAN